MSLHLFKNFISWDFPGGPVVKTPCFQCSNTGGAGSIPGWGTKIPHEARRAKKRKKNFMS